MLLAIVMQNLLRKVRICSLCISFVDVGDENLSLGRASPL